MYLDIPLPLAYRVLGNGRTVLLTTYDRGLERPNAMPVAWTTVLAKAPPLAGFVVGHAAHTYELVRREGEFAVSVPPREMARLLLACGEGSGATRDKFFAHGIDPHPSARITPPCVHGALAHIEFRLEREVDLGDASLLVGRAVACRALEGAFRDGLWNFADPRVRFLHHLGEDRFAVAGESLRARID